MAIQIFTDDNAATGDADKRKGIRVCKKKKKWINTLQFSPHKMDWKRQNI